MALSKRSIVTLIDLVENKLSCLMVVDREDARERSDLQTCLLELERLTGGNDLPEAGLRRRGRRPKLIQDQAL